MEIASLRPDWCIGVDRGVVLSIHRAPMQGPRVGDLHATIAKIAERYPAGLVSIAVFRLSPEFPIGIDAGGNREELAALLRMVDRVYVASASILEFGGVRAITMKLMTRAIYALARPQMAFRQFDSLTEGVDWVRPHARRIGAPTDVATYIRLYRAVDRALEELDVQRGQARSARA